jgi:glycosyltransferase involved in cell wall biosynthesis
MRVDDRFFEKVSVVVPVYNVEKYLDEFFESITNQTYRNMEIIIVDDCSLDGSGKKCDEWAKNDSRITVIHKTQNGGVAKARNTALEILSGQYVFFMDPDDIASPFMIENLVLSISKHDADVAICGYIPYKENEGNPNFILSNNKDKVEDNTRYIEHFMDPFNGPISMAACKLYKVSVIDKVRFENYGVGEDQVFNATVSLNVKKAVWVGSRTYGYRIRQDSLTAGRKKDITYNAAEALLRTYDIFKEGNPEYAEKFIIYCLGKVANLSASSRLRYGKESEKRMRNLYGQLYDMYGSYRRGAGITDRVKLFLARYVFDFYYLLARRNA